MDNPLEKYLDTLSDDEKKAVDGFLEIVGDKADLESAMIEGELMINAETSLTDKQVEGVRDYVSEFLKSFILAGYTYDGQRIVMNIYKNNEEYDANTVMANRILPHFVNNPDLIDEDEDGEYYEEYDDERDF